MTTPGRRPGRARGVAQAVAVLLAALLLPLSMLSIWFSAYVADDDRYVEAVAPLAEDAAVRDAATQAMVLALLSTGQDKPGPCVPRDASGRASGQGTDEGSGQGSSLGRLAGAAAAIIGEGPIRSVLSAIVSGPRFAQAWTGANRSAHTQLVDILKGDDDLVDRSGCVSLDLSELMRQAVPELDALRSSGLSLPDNKLPVASLTTRDLRGARFAYSLLRPLSIVLPVLWGLAVLAALALGRRRSATLMVLGAVSAAGMVLLLLVLSRSGTSLVDAADGSVIARAIFDAVSAPLRDAAVAGLVVSALAAAAGGVLRFRPSRRD